MPVNQMAIEMPDAEASGVSSYGVRQSVIAEIFPFDRQSLGRGWGGENSMGNTEKQLNTSIRVVKYQ